MLLSGNNDYETDMYQVVPVSTWTWGQYSDYVRSKFDTFNNTLSTFVLESYAQDLVSCFHTVFIDVILFLVIILF